MDHRVLKRGQVSGAMLFEITQIDVGLAHQALLELGLKLKIRRVRLLATVYKWCTWRKALIEKEKEKEEKAKEEKARSKAELWARVKSAKQARLNGALLQSSKSASEPSRDGSGCGGREEGAAKVKVGPIANDWVVKPRVTNAGTDGVHSSSSQSSGRLKRKSSSTSTGSTLPRFPARSTTISTLRSVSDSTDARAALNEALALSDSDDEDESHSRDASLDEELGKSVSSLNKNIELVLLSPIGGSALGESQKILEGFTRKKPRKSCVTHCQGKGNVDIRYSHHSTASMCPMVRHYAGMIDGKTMRVLSKNQASDGAVKRVRNVLGIFLLRKKKEGAHLQMLLGTDYFNPTTCRGCLERTILTPRSSPLFFFLCSPSLSWVFSYHFLLPCSIYADVRTLPYVVMH